MSGTWYRRTYWMAAIEAAWRRRPIVWLAGPRRVGKTVLCQLLDDVEYFDCELPSVRRQLRDPELFWERFQGKRVCLDEVHRLDDPAAVLKIAADHHPSVRVLATGSSTLGASARFRDTLAGRREQIWLTPMIEQDLLDFGRPDLERRLVRGGLPPFFLSDEPLERDVQDWLDAYWAKDLQELFRLERRDAFLRLTELLLDRSGGVFQASRLATECRISHTTVLNYASVLEATGVIQRIRPYSKRRATEIVAAPKVYGFDTGFVLLMRGEQASPRELGSLWEHFVLNELTARMRRRRIHYWRDKRGHEVDFVLPERMGPVAIECKWRADSLDPRNLAAFRRRHPDGLNFVVAPDVRGSWIERREGMVIEFVSLPGLIARLEELGAPAGGAGTRGPDGCGP